MTGRCSDGPKYLIDTEIAAERMKILPRKDQRLPVALELAVITYTADLMEGIGTGHKTLELL